ncbi:hypothetical protein [Microbulbifer aggregans]|uniref:hypothetical protein n=1 Tax=Microbulbifer aggregans TaxID=1769779 RepID=UPI001CFD14D3|nr:hypothetical protein [Microbulbifer aggregans]
MRRARRGLSAEDRKGIIVLFAGLALLSGLLVFAFFAVRAPERNYDQVTLCNGSLPRSNHYLMVIDVSDALSAHQQHFLRTHLAGLLESAEVNDRFSIFVLDERYHGLSEPVVDLCKPRSADDVSALTANRQFVQALYRERFEQPLDKAIAAAVAGGEQPVSPIFEALSDVAALNRIDPTAQRVSLTIVSDMIQNSRAGSVFSSGAAAIDQLPLIDLRRATTRVYWLDREKYRKYQTDDLAASWQDYLASVSRFDLIQRVRN